MHIIVMEKLESFTHHHNFLSEDHIRNEWKSWCVIVLCTCSMVLEVTCGVFFGSLALISDGIHMSTHAFAFLVTAMSYSYSRHHSSDPRFVFGTGKIGELSSFTCALVLIGVALYILYEGIYRIIYREKLRFAEALPVAFVGLIVNIVSVMILILPIFGDKSEDGMVHAHDHGHSHGGHQEYLHDIENALEKEINSAGIHVDDGNDPGMHHDHGHGHHSHGGHSHDDEIREFKTSIGLIQLSIYEDGVPPEFRIQFDSHDSMLNMNPLNMPTFMVKTIRSNKEEQVFHFQESNDQTGLWKSVEEIPEPHSFDVELSLIYTDKQKEMHNAQFREGDENSNDGFVDNGNSQKKKKYEHDNNFRGALLHVVADAFVSIIAIVSISIAGNVDGAYFLDPVAGMIGAFVIISWGFQLVIDSSMALLDIAPDLLLNDKIKRLMERDDESKVTDLHIWKLGPSRLGVILSIVTESTERNAQYYKGLVKNIKALAHVTIEVNRITKQQHKYEHIDNSHCKGHHDGQDHDHGHHQ